MGMSKADKKGLMQERGVWSQFVSRREELKKEGMEPSKAWDKACSEYLPEAASGVSPSAGDAEALVERSQFGDTDASAREVVEWVFNNICVADVKPEDAPSPGAWGLLLRVREDSALRKDFYRSMWAKLMPSQAQVDRESEKFEDDGREHFELIEKTQELTGPESEDAVLQPRAEGPLEESGVEEREDSGGV